MKKSALPKIRLFQKVVAPKAPLRSVPAAASRLPPAMVILVLRHLCRGEAPGASPLTHAQKSHFAALSDATLTAAAGRLFTSKALVAAMRELCFAALVVQPELRKMAGYSIGDCSAAAPACNIMRDALWQYTALKKTVPCNNAGNLPLARTFATLRSTVWNALSSAIGVKARIPLWVINEVPNASDVYKACLQCPQQLTPLFAQRIGIDVDNWQEGFCAASATKWAKTIPVAIKARIYLLVHARKHVRSLHLPPVNTTASDVNAIVCVTCASLRSRPHNVSKPRRKTSGVMLDVCSRTVRCGDCNSLHLCRVPLNRRAVADVNGLCTACSQCGALTVVTSPNVLCKRCKPPQTSFSCFCRAHPKFTTSVFLCTIGGKLALQGVCKRHASAVPQSVEAIEVTAARANVRI